MEPHTQSAYDRILNAAEKLFAERGYYGTTTRDIVKEAGASLSSLQTHFQSKDNIYNLIIFRAFDAYYQILSPTLDEVEYLSAEGLLHGDIVWDLLAEIIRLQADWFFKEQNQQVLILFNQIVPELGLNSSVMGNEQRLNQIKRINKTVQSLCEAYCNVVDAEWAKPIEYLILITMYGFISHPEFLGMVMSHNVGTAENIAHTGFQVKNYLLLAIHAYLEARKKAPQMYASE